MDSKSPKLLSMQEVADYVGVSRRTISDLIAAGELEAIKLSDSRTATVRIRPAALEDFLNRRLMHPPRSTGFTSPEAVA